LQIVAGTVAPTEGRVLVHGRIAALLELGAGFNPEFSGLENVRMSAAVLGLDARAIDRRLESRSQIRRSRPGYRDGPADSLQVFRSFVL
jgi:ABC-type polysaccharide/polyol phosphate transport system ATPase subunit